MHRPRSRALPRLALALCLCVVRAAAAEPAALVEHTRAVTVVLRDARGAPLARVVRVRIVRPADGRHPYLLLLHGRPAGPDGRLALGLVDYPANARYLAARGFAVVIPTRVGYGVSGGPDVEYTGPCGYKRSADGVAAAVAETAQLIAVLGDAGELDAASGVLLGESFGGLVAIAAADGRVPGLRGSIGFAPGDGGDVERHPDRPCRPDQLETVLMHYGWANRRPTLWLYSANDRLWGAEWPARWFAAFASAGGRGRYVALPADKNNGHYVFNRNPAAWHAPVAAFLAELGYGADPLS